MEVDIVIFYELHFGRALENDDDDDDWYRAIVLKVFGYCNTTFASALLAGFWLDLI